MMNIDALAGHPFLAGIARDHLAALADMTTFVQFATGDLVLREGEAATTFYLIQHGRVALQLAASHRGAIPIETIEAGEALGWSWLFPPYRWHFSARAIEATAALALEASGVRQFCEADHDLGFALLHRIAGVIAHRLQATRVQLLDVYMLPEGKRR